MMFISTKERNVELSIKIKSQLDIAYNPSIWEVETGRLSMNVVHRKQKGNKESLGFWDTMDDGHLLLKSIHNHK